MVIDTSALLAVLLNEPDGGQFAAAISGDPRRLVSMATVLETSIVVEARHGEPAGRELDLLLHRISASLVEINNQQLDGARSAWRRYGRAVTRQG